MDEALAGRADRGSSRDGGHRALARRADAAGERSGVHPQRFQVRQPGARPCGPHAGDRRAGLGDVHGRRPADGPGHCPWILGGRGRSGPPQGRRVRADLPSRQPDAGAGRGGVRARRGAGAAGDAVLFLLRAVQDRGDRPADLQAVRGGAQQGRAIRGARTRGADPGKRGGRGGRPGEVLAAPAEGWLAATLERKHSQAGHETRSHRDLGKTTDRSFSLAFSHARSYCSPVTRGIGTRDRILDTAFRLAAREGLDGLSLAALAGDLGLSKSGLFAHFDSKEELQLEMLRVASERFVDKVMRPAFKQARGLPRVRALFENWRRWATDPSLPGGCVFVAAAAELDDRDGPVRAYVVSQQRGLLQAIARTAKLAVEVGHFRRDLDVEQLAFEVLAIYLAFHHSHRLLRDPRAEQRLRRAYTRLVENAAARQ